MDLSEALSGRRFSLYPAIRGIEDNEWTLTDSTWSELRIRNCTSGQEYWIPRSHLGEISSADTPILILGLKRELEAKAGGFYAYRKVVTAMPSSGAVPTPTKTSAAASGAPATGGRLRTADARLFRMLGIALTVAMGLGLLGLMGVVGGLHNPLARLFEPDTSTSDQRYLGLGGSDSYFEVVQTLSEPETEEWITEEEAELQFQLLRYPSRGYIVIMMGGGRSAMRYIGTVHDPSREVLDSAELARGGDTSSMMRNLPEF